MTEKYKIFSIFMTSIFILTGCETHIAYHGKMPDTDQLAKIEPGIQSKEDVLGLIGSPSSVNTFDNNTWIYDYKILESEAFFTPREVMHRLYVIHFDAQGKVKKVETKNGHGSAIQPVDRVTNTPGDDRTVLQSVFGNFGKRAKRGADDEKSKEE